MNRMPRRFGRRVCTDVRDDKFPIRQMATDRVSRYWHQSCWWGDQVDTSACVGFSWAHWIEDGPITHAGRKPLVDPISIYDEAKKVDEWEGEDYDGTSVRAGAKVLKSLNLIKSYRWTTKVMTLANAILTQGPCVLGTWWYSGMMDPDASGFIEPTGQILGGHAYLLNGVNMKSGKFRLKQSWGRDWGKAGNAFLTFESVEKLLAQDGEACLAIEMTDKERLSGSKTRS